MKLISWNVNGIRACVGKGFLDFFQQIDADFFCLQETKMQPGQLELELPGYYQYWNSAEKKGYSGTAIFSRIEPLQVSYGLPQDSHNHEGRVITLELEQFYLVTVYTPNSQDQLARLDYRMQWEDDFRAYLQELDYETLSKERSQIIGAQPADIRALKPLIASVLSDGSLCVIGNEDVLTSEKQMFETLESLT